MVGDRPKGPRKTRNRTPRAGAAGSGTAGTDETEGEPGKAPSFTPDLLEASIIAVPLLAMFRKQTETGAPSQERRKVYRVIIDLNLGFPGGRAGARRCVEAMVLAMLGPGSGKRMPREGIYWSKSEFSEQYVFAGLTADSVRELVRRDREQAGDGPAGKDRSKAAIYRIWPDFDVNRLTVVSLSTVKADAARAAFGAYGVGIVWAVFDSGIDATHPHFARYRNLDLEPPLMHRDFTGLEDIDAAPPDVATPPEARAQALAAAALEDAFGHGTHVAGIIAGEIATRQIETPATPSAIAPVERRYRITAQVNFRDENDATQKHRQSFDAMSGVAPRCKLLSLKVLDAQGRGSASSLIAAIEYLQRLNGYGRRLLIHGANMSVGYDFEPEWFACGQSPLCVEVNRLVRSGVSVVVAAGNTGYGWNSTAFKGAVAAGMDLSINDPGNAELAITVGSTHRSAPHTYGVSYFSSKGPTGDGRMKPDLVAPGERILSCAARLHPDGVGGSGVNADGIGGGDGTQVQAARASVPRARARRSSLAQAAASTAQAEEPAAQEARYREDSGTSMAAPHVSGVIAAFLSVRQEFVGEPERVKRIFCDTATDLKRTASFQGRGLVDLMRAIQSI